jgi:hypothetical protein
LSRSGANPQLALQSTQLLLPTSTNLILPIPLGPPTSPEATVTPVPPALSSPNIRRFTPQRITTRAFKSPRRAESQLSTRLHRRCLVCLITFMKAQLRRSFLRPHRLPVSPRKRLLLPPLHPVRRRENRRADASERGQRHPQPEPLPKTPNLNERACSHSPLRHTFRAQFCSKLLSMIQFHGQIKRQLS